MDPKDLIDQLNKDYTNAKLMVLFFGLTFLIFSHDVLSDMVASFSVWGVAGVVYGLISLISFYERN